MSLLRPLYSTRQRPSYHPMRQMKPHRTPPLQRSTQPARALYRRTSIRQYVNTSIRLRRFSIFNLPFPHLPMSPSPHLLHCSLRIHSLCPSPYSLRVVISFSSFPLSYLFVFVRVCSFRYVRSALGQLNGTTTRDRAEYGSAVSGQEGSYAAWGWTTDHHSNGSVIHRFEGGVPSLPPSAAEEMVTTATIHVKGNRTTIRYVSNSTSPSDVRIT